MAKKINKRIKKFKKKSPVPPLVYRLGFWAKTFLAMITGFSFIAIALGGKAYADDIASFLMTDILGRIILFVIGLSLLFYYLIELIRKTKKAPKMIKKL